MGHGGNGAQREPGRFSSPGGQRYPRGGVWRRLPLARHRLRLYFEALEESSLRPALKSYFHPQPKSATAHYTANNGERAARHREELRGGGAETDFSRGRAPGAPAATRPRPKPRGAPAGREAVPARTRGRPERDSLRHRPARRALPGGERGGARPSGSPGVPDRRAGTEDGGRRAVKGPGSALRPPPPGRWRPGVSEPQAGLRRPPSRRLQRGQGRGSPDAGQRGKERGGGEACGTRVRPRGSRSPLGLAPRPGAPTHTQFAPLTRLLQRWCRPGSE